MVAAEALAAAAAAAAEGSHEGGALGAGVQGRS